MSDAKKSDSPPQRTPAPASAPAKPGFAKFEKASSPEMPKRGPGRPPSAAKRGEAVYPADSRMQNSADAPAPAGKPVATKTAVEMQPIAAALLNSCASIQATVASMAFKLPLADTLRVLAFSPAEVAAAEPSIAKCLAYLMPRLAEYGPYSELAAVLLPMSVTKIFALFALIQAHKAKQLSAGASAETKGAASKDSAPNPQPRAAAAAPLPAHLPEAFSAVPV